MSELYHENNEIDEASDDVYYNLMEDIRCLKEDLASANQLAEEAEKHKARVGIESIRLFDENETLKASLADKEGELESLRERLRWRKWPDEKPDEDGMYFVMYHKDSVTADYYWSIKENPWAQTSYWAREGKLRWLPIPTESPDTGGEA